MKREINVPTRLAAIKLDERPVLAMSVVPCGARRSE